MPNPRIPGNAPLIANPYRRWLVIMAVWTGIGLFFCGQVTLRWLLRNQPVDVRILRAELVYYWTWIPLTGLALLAVRRYPITRDRLARTIAIHSLFALLIGFLHEGMLVGILTLTRHTDFFIPSGEAIRLFDPRRAPVNALTGFYKYWALIGIYSAFVNARRSREQQLRAAQIETRLAQAELQALRMQLHPHFLFNTLHAVSMLNFTDVDAANRMLVRLSDLLRMSLDNGGRQQVTLRQELDFLRKYLEIEQTRFHDRLRVQYDVDESLLDAEVPHLVLQPLVENAIRHGIARIAAPGIIEISAHARADQLVLQVCDNGAGLSPAFSVDQHTRIGLSTTIARLKQLYGDAQRFTIQPRAEGGTCAEVVLPLREVPA